MKNKFKTFFNSVKISTNGSSSKYRIMLGPKIKEFNIDFISHNVWKKNIENLEKQQQILKFNFKYNSYK